MRERKKNQRGRRGAGRDRSWSTEKTGHGSRRRRWRHGGRSKREELGLLRDREGLVGLCDLVEVMDGSGENPKEEVAGAEINEGREWRWRGNLEKVDAWLRWDPEEDLGAAAGGRDKCPRI